MKKPKVLVAMSGGVDSSVAAALLKQQGYDLIGITLQIWPDVSPSETKSNSGCCSLSAVEDARRVANALDIPHYVLNFQEIFQSKVIDNFVAEYKAVRTPNPCIRCNEHIKFKALLDKADELGAEYLATGHYARVKSEILNTKSETNDKSQNRKYKLLKGKDSSKDQSYVLYMLNQENLPRILFPLGELTKVEVRKMAAELGLKVADKPDSQEICFVPDDKYGEFLAQYVPEGNRRGDIVDDQGRKFGHHKGIIHYTVGQRRGLGIAYKTPLYVIKIDKEKNQVVVGEEDDTYGDELVASGVSYVGGRCTVNGVQDISAKIRYKTPEYKAKIFPLENNQVKVQFEEPVKAITPGQAVVFYLPAGRHGDGDEVLGGGTIC